MEYDYKINSQRNFIKKYFKDKCDECGNFELLSGVNNRCLCKNCKEKQKEKNMKERQLTIFDINNI